MYFRKCLLTKPNLKIAKYLFCSFSHDDIRRESRRQLYKPIKEAKDGTPTYQVPPFTAVLKYVLERVDALPKRKWLDVANQPVPFSIPVMEQVSNHCFAFLS